MLQAENWVVPFEQISKQIVVRKADIASSQEKHANCCNEEQPVCGGPLLVEQVACYAEQNHINPLKDI